MLVGNLEKTRKLGTLPLMFLSAFKAFGKWEPSPWKRERERWAFFSPEAAFSYLHLCANETKLHLAPKPVCLRVQEGALSQLVTMHSLGKVKKVEGETSAVSVPSAKPSADPCLFWKSSHAGGMWWNWDQEAIETSQIDICAPWLPVPAVSLNFQSNSVVAQMYIFFPQKYCSQQEIWPK